MEDLNGRKSLAKEIRISRWVALSAVVAVLGTYIWKHTTSLGLSNDLAAWGQFGDYVGGLLNPLIAYGAFYWLTRSVLLQKQELEDTRREFSESVKAQTEMARCQQETVKLHALTELLRSTEGQIERSNAALKSLIASQIDPLADNSMEKALSKEVSKLHTLAADYRRQIAQYLPAIEGVMLIKE